MTAPDDVHEDDGEVRGPDGELVPPEIPEHYGRPYGIRRDIFEAAAEFISSADLSPISDEVHNLGTVVADYGDDLERKVEPWAVPTVAPLSATINRRADPTFQLSDFMVPVVRGRSDQEGHNHTHVTTSSAYALSRGAGEKNVVHLAFLTPTINRAYTQLNFMVAEVVDPCRMDVAVYVVDENRVLNRQVYVPDVTSGLGESVATVTFPTWVSTQGSYLAIGWLQHGAGNSRALLGLDDTPRPLMNNVFPRKIAARHTPIVPTALAGAIDGENHVDFNFWFTPYAELSEDVGVDYRVFTDNWTYDGYLGRPWVSLTSPGLASGGGYTAARGSGLRVGMYDTPLSTDFVRVKTSIYNKGNSGSDRRSTIVVRGTNDLRSGVGLSAIANTRYELIEWTGKAVDSSSEWDDRTVIRTISQTPQEGDQIEIDYLDGLVTVRINGTEHITEQAVGGPQGESGRFVGIQNRRQAFITAVYSPWFGPWSARDLPQEASGGDQGEGE